MIESIRLEVAPHLAPPPSTSSNESSAQKSHTISASDGNDLDEQAHESAPVCAGEADRSRTDALLTGQPIVHRAVGVHSSSQRSEVERDRQTESEKESGGQWTYPGALAEWECLSSSRRSPHKERGGIIRARTPGAYLKREIRGEGPASQRSHPAYRDTRSYAGDDRLGATTCYIPHSSLTGLGAKSEEGRVNRAHKPQKSYVAPRLRCGIVLLRLWSIRGGSDMARSIDHLISEIRKAVERGGDVPITSNVRGFSMALENEIEAESDSIQIDSIQHDELGKQQLAGYRVKEASNQSADIPGPNEWHEPFCPDPVTSESPTALVGGVQKPYNQNSGKTAERREQKSEPAGREILSEKPRRIIRQSTDSCPNLSFIKAETRRCRRYSSSKYLVSTVLSTSWFASYYRLLPVMLLRGVYVVDAQSRPRPDSLAVFCNLLFGWLHFGMVPNHYLESSPTSLNQGKILFRDSGCNEPEETASEESPAAASDPRLGIQ
ncbi:hypothetical protein R3P38DRAFT_3365565 [Favolaschia claudopus]|uniref:Uncharacterized protein n=1 Tax=Favolaschia claudopus TaxID=2862362 RepID=A0AAW0AIV6_9AGAR